MGPMMMIFLPLAALMRGKKAALMRGKSSFDEGQEAALMRGKKENQRERKKRPLLAGYGLGTWIRATLARILIPGPDSNPYLRIRVRVLP